MCQERRIVPHHASRHPAPQLQCGGALLMVCSGVAGDAQHFFAAGDAGVNQALAVVAHEGHAACEGGGAYFGFGCAGVDLGAYVVVHHEQFKDAGAPLVAGAAAGFAAGAVPVAARAAFAHEALREHAQQRR